MKKIGSIIQYSLSSAKAFGILLCAYCFSYIRLIDSNYLYNDDQGRKYAGYHGWLDWSRWTDTILSNFIHTDTFLYDISPFTHVLACLILSIASLIAIQIIFEKKEIPLIAIATSLLIGVNPYLIGCFAYKYDSPYMAISIMASIVPLYYWAFSNEMQTRKKQISYMLISVICLLVMFTSYQSSAGIYPMLVIVIVLKSLFLRDDIKKTLDIIVLSVLSYLVSLLFFVKVLVTHRSDSAKWNAVTSIKDILNNYVNHYVEIFSDYKMVWILLIIITLVLFMLVFIIKYHGNKIRGIIYFLLGNLGISIVAFGANLFLDAKGISLLQAKYLYGANIGYAFLMLLFVWMVINELTSDSNTIIVLAQNVLECFVLCIVYCFIIFNFIFGNALEEQWRYNVFRVQEVINDLTDLDIMMDEQDKTMVIEGGIGMAPANKKLPNAKLVKKLLPASFSHGFWGEFYFRYYYDIPNMLTPDRDYEVEDYSEYTLLQKTVYHEIYAEKDEVVVLLKNPEQIRFRN